MNKNPSSDDVHDLLVRTMAQHGAGLSRPLNGGGLAGFTRRTKYHKAKLYIGLNTNKVLRHLIGRTYGDAVIGYLLPEGPRLRIRGPIVIGNVVRMRSEQVDTEKESFAGATVTGARGVYQGGHEASVVVEILYLAGPRGSPKEKTPGSFHRHILRIAEELCSGLCQKEILIEWVEGDGITTQSVSARGLPTPGTALNDWEKERAAELGIEP